MSLFKNIGFNPRSLLKMFVLVSLSHIIFTTATKSQSTDEMPTTYDNVFWGKHHMNAIDASRFADGIREPHKKESPIFVGVAVHVEKNHKETPEAWGEFLAKMFIHYDIPVKIYLDQSIDPGENCVITIYINGFSYRKGDYPNGTISPKYITENHAQIMQEIRQLYDQANNAN